jgi:hypothetical protein
MDAERFTDLIKALAWELGQLRRESWTWPPQTAHATYTTLACGNAMLSLSWNSRAGKLHVAGLGPDGHVLARYGAPRGNPLTWSVNVDPDRGAPALARDINRRILAAGYADDLLAARAKAAERAAIAAARAQWIAQAADLFEVGMPEDGEKLYLKQFVTGSGYVQAHGVDDTDHLDINLSGIPAQVALDMLAVLAESGSVSALCCFTYGSGHHPQFTSVGCLRGKSERGEWPSRNRVLMQLIAHGVESAEASLALTEARDSRYQVSVITDGTGGALAVVSWDHDGCGEFTVELTRAAREAGKARTP